MTTIRLRVDMRQGVPADEEVVVEPCGDSRYRLLKSPGLALGVAAGDLLSVDELGVYEVLERGGNVCVQIFSKTSLKPEEPLVTAAFDRIGGRLDGQSASSVGSVLVYTIAVSVGFPAIQSVLAQIAKSVSGIEWYYGNVYDPVDGVTPLNWWK